MTVIFKDGVPLFSAGVPAMHINCCCDGYSQDRSSAGAYNITLGIAFGAQTFGKTDFGVVSSWYRFASLPISGSVGTAVLEFVSSGDTTTAFNAETTCNAKIYACDQDSAAAPSSYADFAGRPRTSGTTWNNVPSWSPNGTTVQSIDFTAEVNAVLGRVGWVSGNALLIFVEDNGSGPGRARRTCDDPTTLVRLILA